MLAANKESTRKETEKGETMYISVENLNHAKACRKYFEDLTGQDIRYTKGYKLYQWCNKYLDNLDWTVQKFWVCKINLGKYKRGMKLMTQSEKTAYENMGGKTREILCHKKETRQAMSELTAELELTAECQHGFAKGKDIFTLMSNASNFALQRNFKVSVASIDLENAFCQINEEQVYAMLRHVYQLNVKQSEELSKRLTHNGRLFQGNVWSPLLFNLWFVRVIARIQKIQANNRNFQLYTYADDITLITLYQSMSWKFLKFIMRIITQCGFKINKAKTKVRSGINMEICGLQYKTPNRNEWKIYPRNTHGLKKKIRMWEYLERSYPYGTTKRLNRTGTPISIQEMKNGLENWYHRSTTFQPV